MHWLLMVRIQLLTWLSGPFAALISLQTLQNALSIFGYPAVTLFVMIESSGIPFPGETMLLLAAFFAALYHQLQIPIVIACAAAGAIIGDNIGYYAGRTGGRALVARFGRYLFLKPEHLDRAERFFEKHGNKTVFFGRFIAVLRAWAAFLAGVNRMPWRVFLIYNAAGGILWATIFGILGFEAGRIFGDNFAQVERIARDAGWLGALIVVAIVLGYISFRLFFSRRRRPSTPSTAGKAEQPVEKSTKQDSGDTLQAESAESRSEAQPAAQEEEIDSRTP